MITRTEFYIAIVVIAGLIAYIIWGGHKNTSLDVKKAGIEIRDSVLVCQRDLAMRLAGLGDKKSDSLQMVIDRQKQSQTQVHEKYIYIEKAVVRFSADSSLAWFLRAIH